MSVMTTFDRVYLTELDSADQSRLHASWFHADPTCAPAVRGAHTLTAVSSSRAVLFGGATRSAVTMNETFIYDMTQRQWTEITCSTSPPARAGHTAVAVDDTVYVIAGQTIQQTDDGAEVDVDFLSDVWRFHVATLKWTTKQSSGDAPRRNGASSWTFNGAIYVFGGSDNRGPTNTLHRLILPQHHWTKLIVTGDVPVSVEMSAVCCIGEFAYVYGGRSADGIADTLYRFDCVNATWKLLGHGPPRCSHSLFTDTDANCSTHRLIVFGGTDGAATYNDAVALTVADGQLVDCAVIDSDETNKSASTLPAERFAHAACNMTDSNGASSLLIFGGMNETNDLNDTIILTLTVD